MKILVRLVQRAAERRLRVSAEYLGHFGEATFSGFLKFLAFLPAAGHRRRAPRDLIHAARLVATRHEDCGPCVQIAVYAALDDGVEPGLLRAILEGEEERVPARVARVVRWTRGVVAADGSDAKPREELERELESTVMSELALAIATARVFPTLKRGLGFARACRLAAIENESEKRDRATV